MSQEEFTWEELESFLNGLQQVEPTRDDMGLLMAVLASFREVGRACRIDTEAAKDGYLVIAAPELGVTVLVHRSIAKKRWLRSPRCVYHVGIGNVVTGLWRVGALGMDAIDPVIAFLNKAYTEAEDAMFAEY